ncbi:hypothetical protein JTE90_026754 [Oedothorax gibbosus]|uniref:Uncharacterized protein n=1 Tax=Oedothorax gibbosus TaxID=931172 RepID=A0AAV6UYA4_9ARAC|nr:hypothetical protein JTE90_026754 [Oedothorax gibbosus]
MAKICCSFLLMAAILKGLEAVGSNCNIMQNCEPFSPLKKLNHQLPSSESELNSVCPEITQYAQCLMEEAGNCTRHDLFERTANLPDSVAVLFNLQDLILQTCNESSPLYRGYLAGIKCFTSLLNETDLQQHRYDGLEEYDAYRETRAYLNERREPDERQCMATASAVAKFSHQLQQTCGEETKDIFLRLLKRLRTLLRNYSKCTIFHVTTLRTKFMAFLNEFDRNEQRRSIFSAVFKVM